MYNSPIYYIKVEKMNKSTKIILIRHGESLGNATRTILGHTDMDLSEHGYLQAETTANYLKNEKIDIIYSSDLKRAYNTALPNAKIRDLEVLTDKSLREIYVGDWEGLKVSEIIEKWGRGAFEDDWHGHFGTFTFPGGEFIQDGGKRFYNKVLELAEQNIGKTILITAHAAVIRAFWAIITSTPWENVVNEIPFATNASFSICYFDGKTIIPDIYSYDDHLIKVGITRVKV
jgi:broad specificity phosphatase PhoE